MSLKTKRIAILVERDYQDLEVWFPALRFREEGIAVDFVGTDNTDYKGKFGYPVKAARTIDRVRPADYDAVLIPGGWAPDFLRRYQAVLDFVRAMDKAGKTVAAICHAGWVLASADIVRGRTVTCFSAIKDDVRNAGANYVDREVAIDGNLITARKPDDLPAFCRAIIDALVRGPVNVRANAPGRPKSAR